MIKIRLTDAYVQNLKPSEDGRYYEHDAGLPGLVVVVHPTGKKAWCIYKTVRYKPRRVTLGWFPVMSTMEARRVGSEVIAALLNGEEITARWKLGSRPTFSTIFEQYKEQHLKQFTAKKTYIEVPKLVEKYGGDLLNMPLDEMRPLDLQARINQIIDEISEAKGKPSGSATAIKFYNTFAACLEWAKKMGILTIKNDPTIGVNKPAAGVRNRYIKPGSEFQRFRASLLVEEAESKIANRGSQDAVDTIWIALHTGQRQHPIFSMEWAEVDFVHKHWVIPGHKMKSKKTVTKADHVVPLDDYIIELLQRRRFARSGSKYVFPSRQSASGHLEQITGWHKILKRAGIDPGEGPTALVFHSLRDTHATMMGMTGANAMTIQQQLGHADIKMSAKYTHGDIATRRGATNAALHHLQNAGNDEAALG